MAKNDKKDSVNELSVQSSQLVFGTDDKLNKEDQAVENVVKQTIIGAKTKFGSRTNGQPINYFNEISFGSAFREILNNKNKEDGNNTEKPDLATFKDYMTKDGLLDVSAALMSDADRLVAINNYRIMRTHIPECAAALEAYKVNIMSPDDFTKMIFNVRFKDALKPEIEEHVRDQIEDIKIRYDIEKLSDEIIGDTLTTGESYIAVLSLEDELNSMLNDPLLAGRKSLNEEDASLLDPSRIDVPVLKEDINLSATEKEAFSEAFTGLAGTTIDESQFSGIIAKMINENVEIGSKKELLIERAQADIDYANKGDAFGILNGTGLDSKKDKNPKRSDNRPIYVNGSSLKKLEPEKVIELKIDNVCYGYYYAEDTGNTIGQANFFRPQTGREVGQGLNIASNNTISGTTSTSTYAPSTTANLLGVSDQKLKVISDVFINSLAKKVDKAFIRKNKKFKDFIYSLVKQDYIIKKGLKLTYFAPQEVIKFECPSIYRRVTFFAKLYLSILTDNILVKLGRAHDKRIFYVNVGADANYEQAIQSVIQDIKTKDYKMDALSDFNTILSLNPGRWDDYFMPVIGGDRPIEIETAPGMDTEMNSEFMEYLKNSMMTGMGVPRNLIDATADMDFARSVSAQNANFVRDIIKYQKLFTEPFQRLIRQLYRNEYRFNGNSESNVEQFIAIDNIEVYFNSPAALNMSNISEQISVVDQNADFIASQIIVPAADGSNEELRVKLKSKIVKDLTPGIDWDKYNDMYEQLKIDEEERKVSTPKPVEPAMDPYGQY